MREESGLNAKAPQRFYSALLILGFSLSALYLGQNWRLKPTDTDDGLILDYIHQMSLGALPHWDMVDAYGFFNWLFPVLFYKLAGQKVWAVHLWVLILKLLSVFVCYRTVARVANRTYATIAALWLVMLLGQGWQPLQSPYAFMTVLPLVFGTWHFLIVRPFQRAIANVLAAALFTTLALWTKLNTGLYLFAGGVFTLSCFGPSASDASNASNASDASDTSGSARAPLVRWLTRGRVALCCVYGVAFYSYAKAYMQLLYVAYLIAPLFIALAFAVFRAGRDANDASSARRDIELLAIYAGTTLGVSVVILLAYYGIDGAIQYGSELSGILRTIRYHYDFPPVGKKWFFIGFNDNYWPELPWLLTALFCIWLVLQRRLGEPAFGSAWPRRRAQASAVFVLATLHVFVLYPRSDDVHLFQALLPAVPAIFIVLFQTETMIRTWRPGVRLHLQRALALAGAVYATTLFERPTLEVFTLKPGDYENPRLEYLDYRPPHNPRITSFAPQISDRDWDHTVDEAARYVDSITRENEPILVLCDVRLLHFISRTRSVGGRYAFYFYLIAVRLLDRNGFDELVPGSVLANIMSAPPRVIVTRGDNESFVPQFPELRAFRDEHYVETKVFHYIHVYELKSRTP